MISALICSAYIIYLYRKLNAAAEQPAEARDESFSAINTELAELNAKLAAIETRIGAKI